MISASQLRSARALLNLPQDAVAGHCGIKKNTLSDIENERTPGKAATLRALELFYENRGLEFLAGDGVRRSATGILVFKGAAGFRDFYDDLYETARTVGGDICLFNGVSDLVTGWLGAEHVAAQKARMDKIKNNFSYRVIVAEGDDVFFGADYCEYRWCPKEHFNDKTFFIYGSKVGFANFDNDDCVVTVIDQKEVADSQRLLFDLFWRFVAIEIEGRS